MAQVGEVRPGYELWRPNRERTDAKMTKTVVMFVLFASAALLAIITLGGWERLQSPGVGFLTLAWAGLYVLFGLLAFAWNRGILPVAASLAVIMIIFAAVSAPGWFARDKEGLNSPALPEDLLGLLIIVVIPVQLLLVAVAMVGFNQDWHVEEERPAGGGRLDESAPEEPATPAATTEQRPEAAPPEPEDAPPEPEDAPPPYESAPEPEAAAAEREPGDERGRDERDEPEQETDESWRPPSTPPPSVS